MELEEFLKEWNSTSDKVLVHTSGSTGTPKPMWVEKARMQASARTTCDFLGLRQGDTALLCMSLDYIAGKMMVVRSLTCGLRLITVKPSGHPLATLNEAPCFAAMVPMQVYNSLRVPRERVLLQQIKHLIIGGGAVDADMEHELRGFPNAVWSTYGMTETLSHIALRRLSGDSASQYYTPFKGVDICLADDGCLVIKAPAICRNTLRTNDIAVVDEDGRSFRILGRKDNTICSGGIKIQIEEVERLLHPHLHSPYMLTKRPDPKFGECAVLLTEASDLDDVASTCRDVLPPYWQPRHYLHVEHIPLTATGKPARAEAERIARTIPEHTDTKKAGLL